MQNDINNQNILPVGTTLKNGQYRIVRHLKSGGFGNTYVVEDTSFHERSAMKEFFIHAKGVNSRSGKTVTVSNPVNEDDFLLYKRKFIHEIQRLRELHNRHVVRIYDDFEENNTAYYVMEFIDGESLTDRLSRTGRAMTEAEVTDVLRQVLNALTEVHGKGFVHADITPNNIMIDKSGNVVLIDFGSTKEVEEGNHRSTLAAMTRTPGYTPQEQLDGDVSRMGPWSDFYALGVTLFRLLTLESPLELKDKEEEAFAPYQDRISQPMRDLILWMTKPNRRKRPQSVAEILAFVKENFKGRPSETHKQDETTLAEDKKKEAKDNKTAFGRISDAKDETEFAGKRSDKYEKEEPDSDEVADGDDSTGTMKGQEDEYEEEEQSFVQKYWKHGAIIIVLVLGIVGGLYVKNNMGADDTIQYYTDLSSIQIGDYLYADGTYTHKLDSTNLVNCSGCVYNLTTIDSEKEEGWTHGHIVALKDAVNRNGETEFTWGDENSMIPNIQSYSEAINAKDGYYYCLLDSMSQSPAICSTADFNEPLPDKSHWYVPTLSDWKDILVNLGKATITEENESLMSYNNKTVSRTLHDKIGGFVKNKRQSNSDFDYNYWTCIQQGKKLTPDGIFPRAWAIYADNEFGMIGNSPTKNKMRVRPVAAF